MIDKKYLKKSRKSKMMLSHYLKKNGRSMRKINPGHNCNYFNYNNNIFRKTMIKMLANRRRKKGERQFQ